MDSSPLQSGGWDWVADALKSVWGLVLTLLGFIGLRAQRAIDKQEKLLQDKVDKNDVTLMETRIMDRLEALDTKTDRKHDQLKDLLIDFTRRP